jgi:hypothetical protein
MAFLSINGLFLYQKEENVVDIVATYMQVEKRYMDREEVHPTPLHATTCQLIRVQIFNDDIPGNFLLVYFICILKPR